MSIGWQWRTYKHMSEVLGMDDHHRGRGRQALGLVDVHYVDDGSEKRNEDYFHSCSKSMRSFSSLCEQETKIHMNRIRFFILFCRRFSVIIRRWFRMSIRSPCPHRQVRW